MLVLSRHASEKIVFPEIGVTLQVLRIKDKIVRIGIEAPSSLRVLRHELHDSAAKPSGDHSTLGQKVHARNNTLNKITLALHLVRKLREQGSDEQAEAVLADLFATLDSAEGKVARVESAPLSRSAGCRTLLVEDDANERQLLAGLLGMNGCECATAADGEEALDYLSAHDRPDIILLDMGMPRCDGPSTLEAIRREPRYQGMKVYSISGASPESLGITTGPKGIDAWFPKPLDPAKLCAAIRKSSLSPSVN